MRLLDRTGMEVVRINDNDGSPTVVPKENLQNKSKRYYFEDAFKLQEGEIFVSPFDLNIEKGTVEEPRKPMIRFGTPVFHQDNTKYGIVLLNYYGRDLLNKINELREYATGHVMLVNRDSYWLLGRNHEEEWGFMYDKKREVTFQNSFPEAWKTINGNNSGQFKTEAGMFTFTTIYPLVEGLKSSTGSTEAYEKSAGSLSPKNYYWKLISYVPVGIFATHVHPTKINYILLNIFFAVILAFGCWVAADAKQQRRKAEQELKESEKNLKEAQHIAKLGHWEHDIISNTLSWSDEVYRIFGLSTLQFKGTLDAFLERVHPHDRDRITKAYKDSINNQTQYDLEHRIVLDDGSEKSAGP